LIQPLTIAVSASYMAASARYWLYAPSLIFVDARLVQALA
jgi:hypothetical protein